MSTLSKRSLVFDITLALGLWVVFSLSVLDSDFVSFWSGSSLSKLVVFLIASGQTIPLIWRRINPVAAGSVIVAFYLLQVAAGIPLAPSNVSVFVTVYTLAAYGPRWASNAGYATAMFGGVIWSTMLVLYRQYQLLTMGLSEWIGGIVFSSALVSVTYLAGRLKRQRRLNLLQLEDRAVRLERESAQERALAQADERARIAREMHDIVAHSLSVIITQADGARYAAVQKPEVAVETLETIAEQGRESLAEMRRLLGVLRTEDEAATNPAPGLAEIAELVERTAASGLPTMLEWHGSPRGRLPAGAELVAFRIVQESLTNVLKHAGPKAKVAVNLTWGAKGLAIDVTDDGRGAGARVVNPESAASGQGLRGMRERVLLYNGSLAAGPRSGGGFRVRADLPYEEK